MSMRTAAAAAAAAVVLAGQPTLADNDALVKRGEYLVNGPAACSNCHAMRNPDFTVVAGMEFAGGFRITLPELDVYAANITPDMETGIGGWSDAEIIRAIREGVASDGTIIFPPMPVPTYNNMSDDDVKAIVAYLRTLKPVKHEVSESTWNMPQQAMPPAKGLPAPDRADPVAYGGYLANAVAHCFECHTPMGPQGPDMTRAGAGGFEIPLAPGISAMTPNITPDPDTGIGKWSDDDIRNALVGGVRPDGSHLSPPMPLQWFSTMTPEDLDAIVAYLRTIPAVANKVERTAFQKANFP